MAKRTKSWSTLALLALAGIAWAQQQQGFANNITGLTVEGTLSLRPNSQVVMGDLVVRPDGVVTARGQASVSGWTTNDWSRGSALDLLQPPRAISRELIGSAVKRMPDACGKTIRCTTTAMLTFRWSKLFRRR